MIDPKAAAGTLGGAAASLLWILLATFVDAVERMDAGDLVTVTGATAVLFTAVLAYFTPNLASKLLERGAQLVAAQPTGTNVELTTAMPEGRSDPHEGSTGTTPAPMFTAPPGVPTE